LLPWPRSNVASTLLSKNCCSRWKQRFQNFDRAVGLLHEPFEREVATLSNLEKEGTVQRFEITVELAWKTLKDYLEYDQKQALPG